MKATENISMKYGASLNCFNTTTCLAQRIHFTWTNLFKWIAITNWKYQSVFVDLWWCSSEFAYEIDWKRIFCIPSRPHTDPYISIFAQINSKQIIIHKTHHCFCDCISLSLSLSLSKQKQLCPPSSSPMTDKVINDTQPQPSCKWSFCSSISQQNAHKGIGLYIISLNYAVRMNDAPGAAAWWWMILGAVASSIFASSGWVLRMNSVNQMLKRDSPNDRGGTGGPQSRE